jgi:tRNA threonylcarbamoyladenosine biosynthesis protein TsaB
VILGIETSSKNCSLALWHGHQLLGSFDQVSEDFLHAEILHQEIEKLLKSSGVQFSDLSSVVVGSGPGSYTGLRIGVAAAKGLAMALSIPLFAVSGLQMMLSQNTIDFQGCVLVVMDARRNEVFGAWRNLDGSLTTAEAIIVDEDLTRKLSNNPLMVIGENASKLKSLLSDQTIFVDILPSILSVFQGSIDLGNPVDLAYFEPVYVKPFIPTVAKK